MSKTIVVHSFVRDTGKKNLAVRLAILAATAGRRVGIVEAEISLPDLHTRFRLDSGTLGPTINDYLLGRGALQDAAIDVGNVDARGNLSRTGALFFVPASTKSADISDVLQERIDVTMLHAGFAALIARHDLDLLFVNAPAGLDEISLSCIALADVLIVSLRLDKEETHGTSVVLDLAQRLTVPEILLVVNRVSDEIDPDEVRREVEAAYGHPAPVVLTVAEETEMMFGGRSNALDNAPNPLSPLMNAIQAEA